MTWRLSCLDPWITPTWSTQTCPSQTHQFVYYFKRSENLENIRYTNGQSLVTLPVYIEKRVSVSISVCKSSKDPKSSKIWCHYCNKNKQNAADCRTIVEIKQQKTLSLKPYLYPERSLWSSFWKKSKQSKGRCNWSLKWLQVSRISSWKAESLFSPEINFTTSSDEDTSKEYFFASF
jgi:hypothetical protein